MRRSIARGFIGISCLAIASMVSAAGASALTLPPSVPPAPNPFPYDVVGAFSTRSASGYLLAFADGYVMPLRAGWIGDASQAHLSSPIVAGALRPNTTHNWRLNRYGYWLVTRSGAVYGNGWARYKGGMNTTHLNAPIVAIAPTATGQGYWLTASDGGVFSFGDARFHGSAGALPLREPIVAMTASTKGQGYRMVARDGGIFTFGNAGYYGSLPGRGLSVSDVVGMAPTPTNKGYWIARADGEVYAFGDAQQLRNAGYEPSACDPVVAIFANPRSQGFRLLLRSAVTIPFGDAPAGRLTMGPPGIPPKTGAQPVQCAG